MYQLLFSNNKDLKHCMCLILPFSFYCVTHSVCTRKEQTLSSVIWLAVLGRPVSVWVLDLWFVAVGVVCLPSLHGRLERGGWLYPPF